MRLCVNCRYFQSAKTMPDHVYGKCAYGVTTEESLVTGEVIEKTSQTFRYCEGLRKSADAKDCGASGMFFEPREIEVAA
jgi:hypothetical protein